MLRDKLHGNVARITWPLVVLVVVVDFEFFSNKLSAELFFEQHQLTLFNQVRSLFITTYWTI